MKKLTYGVFSLLMIAFISCAKEDTEPVVSASNGNSTNNSKISARLSDNPYEKYGIRHNQFLDAFAVQGNLAILTRKQRYDLAAQILQDRNPNHVTSWQKLNQQIGYGNSLNPNNGANKLINDGLITENTRTSVTKLLELIERVDKQNKKKLVTPSEFSLLVEEVENFIYANSEVLYNEKTEQGNDAASLLGACSVARYSYQYWYDVSFDVNHNWYSVFINNNGNGNGNNANARRPGWLKRTWNDIKAFVSDLGCGNVDLNCQWENASEVSAGV